MSSCLVAAEAFPPGLADGRLLTVTLRGLPSVC